MKGKNIIEGAGTLLLLVGTNPLPVYISAVLAADQSTQIFLLHSKRTYFFAENIRQALVSDFPVKNISLFEIKAREPALVRNSILAVLNHINQDCHVVLNFTGGTKVMSAVAYHEIKSRFLHAEFIYLDANSLSLIVEKPSQNDSLVIPLENRVALSFTTLLGLHGYECGINKKNHSPICVEACRKIASHVAHDARSWRNWCDRWLRRMKPIPEGWDETLSYFLPGEDELTEVFKTGLMNFLEWAGCDEINSDANLKKIEINQNNDFHDVFESLQPGRHLRTMEDMVGGENFFRNLGELAGFLDGGWLEHYCLHNLLLLKEEGIIHEALLNIVSRDPNPHRFELDAVAMRGYQLFVISCTTSTERSLNKSRLFEAFARSRQIGGDESRFGVVSAYPAAAELEKELREEWKSKNVIRVFGPDCLMDLSRHLAGWINAESQTKKYL